MSFNTDNRSTLINSSAFLGVVRTTLDRDSIADQLLVTISIWKLIAKNYKAKNIIKNSSIYGQLKRLKGTIDRNRKSNSYSHSHSHRDSVISSTDETTEDLSDALKFVLDILK